MLNFQDIRSKYPGADSLTDDQLIGVFADKYGTTPEVFKQAIDYQPPPGESAGAAFKRGAVESFKQLPQLGYGVLAGAGAVAENIAGEGGLSTGFKNFAVKKYEEKSADIAKGAQANDEFSTAYDKAKAGDIGALGDWLAHGLGYVGGQAVQMVGTAGVGSLAGKVAAKGIAENLASSLVSKEAAAIAASEAGAKLSAEAVNRMAVSKVAGQIGEQAALAGTSFGMEGGEIFGDLVQKATKEGRQLTGDDLFRAGVGTTVAGLLEYGEKLTGLAAMKGKLPLGGTLAEATGFGGRFARGVAGASMAAPLEYGQEFGQTLAEEYGKGDDPFSEASFKQAKNAAALGALGGSAHGIIGGALTGAQPKTPQQAVADIANAPDVDSAIKAAEEAVNAGPKVDDFLSSLAAMRQQVKTDEFRQALREAQGVDIGQFQNAVSVAANPVLPMATRQRAMQFVTDAIAQIQKSEAQDVGTVAPANPVDSGIGGQLGDNATGGDTVRGRVADSATGPGAQPAGEVLVDGQQDAPVRVAKPEQSPALIAQGNAQPTTLGKAINAVAGPGFNAQNVLQDPRLIPMSRREQSYQPPQLPNVQNATPGTPAKAQAAPVEAPKDAGVAAVAQAVPAAPGSAGVEAAGSAPVSPTTGVTNGPQAAQAQQSIAQSTQARGAATAGQSATVGGSGVQADGVKAVSQINKLVAELESLGNKDSQYSGKDYAQLVKSADQKTIDNTIGALRTAIAYQKQVNAKTATNAAPSLATGAVVASKDVELADKFKEFAVSNGFVPHELALAATNPQAFNAANHEIVYALEAMNAVKDKSVAEMASAWDRINRLNAEKAEKETPQVKNAKLSVGDEVTFRGPSVQEGKGVVESTNQDGSIGIKTKGGVYKFAPDAKIAFTKTEEKQPAAETQSNDFVYNGVRIYKAKIKFGNTVEDRFAVESNDNKQRRESGDRNRGGDSLFATLDEAKADADRQIKRDAQKEESAAQIEQEKKSQDELKKALESDNYNGFLDGLPENRKALVRKALSKELNFQDGGVMTIRARIEGLFSDGNLEPSTDQVPVIQPMSRAAFNRATQREQDAHEKKMREAGTKTEYLVNGSLLGKTGYDYSKHLLSQKQEPAAEGFELGMVDSRNGNEVAPGQQEIGDQGQQPAFRDGDTATQRDKLKGIADRLGVLVNERSGGFHASGRMVDVPAEDVQTEGAISPNHVFAHELGHAAMQKRGIDFAGHPISQMRKWAPNWDDLVAASKAFRPAVWNNGNDKISRHARKPNEVLADAIASVYLGINDISLLQPWMKETGTNLHDLGLSEDKPAADTVSSAAQATAILDAAEVKGKERIDVLKDVKSGTITPEEVQAAYPASAGKFEQHNAIANEYGYVVAADGTISLASGKESGLKVVPKGSRFQIRSKTTDAIVYSGGTVDSMGKFLESFWGAEKTPTKPDNSVKPEAGGMQFSRTTTGTPTLIIQHNLTEENLLHADRMGGIPVPSLAITQAEHPLVNFGEITLVGGVDMANPKGYAATKVFGADIYSPRYPRVTYSFTANMKSRGEAMLKDALKATDSRIEWSEVATRGADELRSNPAIRWQVLTDNGLKPEIIRTEAKPLPKAMEPFANDNRPPHELAQDPAFIEAAYKAHEVDLVRMYDGDTKAAQEELAQLKERANERGVSYLVRGYANDVQQHQRDTRSAGAIDRQATNRAMEVQIEEAGLRDKLEVYSKEYLRQVNPDEKLFQGFTNMGNRKYIPHTLDNVIKILKKDMVGGEGFNYGVGSVRSRFTPQFKSIAEIQKAKGRLMDEKAFDLVKEEVNNELSELSNALRSYHDASERFGFGDTVTSTLSDSAKMGLSRALTENGFKDVPQEVKEQIAEFLGKLRNMPTAYFEAKILRAVDVSEFKGAVVPTGTSQKAIDALARRGITNIKYYDKSIDGDRAAKIQELAKESDLLFSRANTQNPTTVQALQSAIRDLVGAFGGNKLGRIVATTAADIKSTWEPLIGKTNLESEGNAGKAQAFYDPKTNTVFLIADHIEAGNETAVLAHELMHKWGKQILGEAGWNKLHSVISSWADAKEGSQERQVYDQASAAVDRVGVELSSEELFPYAVEAAIKMGIKPNMMTKPGTVTRWLAEVRNALKQVWEKIIGKPDTFKAQDLVNLAFGIAQMENPELAAVGGFKSTGQTDTPAFRKWFGDSKVVDAEGKPLVVYHGTTYSDIYSFKPQGPDGDKVLNLWREAKANNGRFGYMNFRGGSFFSPHPEYAGNYTHENTGVMYPVYIKAENPIYFDQVTGKVSGVDPNKTPDALFMMDGDIINEIAVIDPTQIKSAIGNNGNFDPSNPDIRYARGEPTAPDSFGAAMAARGIGTGNVDPGIRFSLSAGGGLNSTKDLASKANQTVKDLFNAPGSLSWWHKSVGTMHNLANRSPQFKRVFDSVQEFLGDVSFYATEAADLAPTLLPKLENWRDIFKSAISASDTKAIAAPIFEGTLTWMRDESGKAVKLADQEEKYKDLNDSDKASMLLRKRVVTEQQLKRWLESPLDIYHGAVRNRFEQTFLSPGIVFSDAELKGLFNLTPNQIGLYREFRAATDKSLNNMAISEMLRYGGKDVDGLGSMVMDAPDADTAAKLLADHLNQLAEEDPDRAVVLINTAATIKDKADKITKLTKQGYAPLSRFGHYTVDVLDEEGERAYFGMFESKGEANRMARQMRTNYPQGTITQGTVSEQAYKMFSGITPETLELFGEMVGLEGDDARAQMFQEYLKLAKSNRSAMKRLIHRKGIAGFSEDAGRVLAGFVYSNARLTSTNLHTGEITKATADISKSDGELKDTAIKLADYVRNPQEEAQAIRGMLFAQYLGGSLASAMVNMTQPFTVTMPYLSQWGGAVKSANRMRSALSDAIKKTTGDVRLDAALKRAEEEGIVSPQEVHSLMAQARGQGALQSGDGTIYGDARAKAGNALSKFGLAWGRPFAIAEQFNRRITFIAAYRTAIAEGIANPAKFAEKAIQETQFVYNKGNRPSWARGAVGSTLFTFKQYSISYAELLHRMSTQGGPEGKKAALFALAMMFLAAGAGGLPFMGDAEDIIDGIAQRLGYSFSTKQARRQFLIDSLGSGAADFVERGVSGLPGVPIDVAGRLGMSNLIPGTGLLTKKPDHTRDVLEFAGPAGDFIKRGFEGAESIVSGEVVKGVATMAPKAVANAKQAVDMYQTGMYRDQKDRKVIDVDGYDALAKAIGFQPVDVARVQDATGVQQNLIGQNKMMKSSLAEDMAKAIFEKDADKQQEIRESMQKWNKRNPESPVSIDMVAVRRRLREMNLTKAERVEKSAPKAIRADVKRALSESPA